MKTYNGETWNTFTAKCAYVWANENNHYEINVHNALGGVIDYCNDNNISVPGGGIAWMAVAWKVWKAKYKQDEY